MTSPATMDSRKIGIMGTSITSGNRGVLALGVSLLNLCCEARPDCDLVLLLSHNEHRPVPFKVGGRERLIPIVPCRLSPRSRPQDHLVWIVVMSILYRMTPSSRLREMIANSTPWIRTVVDCEIVGDVRGGDSFSDIYGMGRFVLGFLMAWSVVLVRGEIVQFPQTYGPFKSRTAGRLARFLLRRSSAIIARDERSQAVAQELVGDAYEVRLSPDVAFSLAVDTPQPVALAPAADSVSPLPVIGLNVNGLMYRGGYTRDNMFGLELNYGAFLTELVTSLLAEHPGDVWLVPHTFAPPGDVESDQEASRALRDSLPEALRHRVRTVVAEYDQHQIKGVIGQCDFFIGSRMHACIAALSQGIPCVGVAYSMKFEGVFASVGMGEWVVDGRSMDNRTAVTRVLELYRTRNQVRGDLRRRAEQARAQLRDVFREIFAGKLEAAHDHLPISGPGMQFQES